MRRALTTLMITLLLAASAPATYGQQGDMAYFDEFDGLQRVIARSWMAPLTYSSASSSQTVEINNEGTPTVVSETFSTPSATPEPQTGIAMLNVFTYLFESDDHAASGFDRVDSDLQETISRDPRAPMLDDLPLEGIGDQAIGYTGDLTQDNITFTYTFATVQDGPFVYSLSGMFAGVDSTSLTRNYAEAMVRTPMNRMAEQYDQNGGSRGGLWAKLNAVEVEPDMPDGSNITDLLIYPMPNATPNANLPEAPKLNLDDPSSIPNLDTIDHATYAAGESATPSPDQPGVFRIDIWILTFDSPDAAHTAGNALNNTLIAPFGIYSGGAGSSSEIGDTNSTFSAWNEGFIADRSLPAGNGVVLVQQDGPTLAGIAVYAIDEDPRPVADDIMQVMTSDSTTPPENRLPDPDDPVLQGPVPSVTPAATATPAS